MSDIQVENSSVSTMKTVIRPAPVKLVFNTIFRMLIIVMLVFGFIDDIRTHSKKMEFAVLAVLFIPITIFFVLEDISHRIELVQETVPTGQKIHTIIEKSLFGENQLVVNAGAKAHYVPFWERWGEVSPRCAISLWRITSDDNKLEFHAGSFSVYNTQRMLDKFCLELGNNL